MAQQLHLQALNVTFQVALRLRSIIMHYIHLDLQLSIQRLL